MRAALCLAFLLLASSAEALQTPLPELALAQREQRVAEARLARLEQAVRAAGNAAQHFASDRAAAGAAIDAAEAKITTAEIELRQRSAELAQHRRRMAEVQRPVAALLAGLAMMGERPPILALADQGGAERLVRTRILLDSVLPSVKARSAALEQLVRKGQSLQNEAERARASLVASRAILAERQKRFAVLEERALKAATETSSLALEAGDQVLAGRESIAAMSEGNVAAARRMAAELLAEEPVPQRPGGQAPAALAPFAYRLPSAAPVIRGLGEIDQGGVRSRGLVLAAGRGSTLLAPADGVVRYSGPFERHDGILIVDHGARWISVLINLASPLKTGDRVQLGQPIGRALGPVEVELSHGGKHLSPALIAGSSPALFKERSIAATRRR